MPTRVTSKISLDGPFFSKDPGKTFRQNIRLLTAAIAAEAEADIRQQMRVGEGQRAPMRGITPDRTAGHVVGRVTSVRGRPWAVTAVASINNSRLSPAQGIRLMAAAATVERRVHAFRRTTSRMRRAKALNQAELLKGLK